MHQDSTLLPISSSASSGSSTCKPGWSQVTCRKIYIYTLAKNILYAKLTYCDYPNKIFEHPNLIIIKIWVQQK